MWTPINSYGLQLGRAYAGEDRMIMEILRRVGVDRGTCCEFGASDGLCESNIWALMVYGLTLESGRGEALPAFPTQLLPWWGVMIEADPQYYQLCRATWAGVSRMHVVNRRVSCEPGETIDEILDDLGVTNLEVLSIDIDTNDYWVFQGLRRRPAVVVIEYNQFCDPTIPVVRPYDPQAQWQGDGFYGASAAAMIDVGRNLGYRFVGHTLKNLLFAKDVLCTDSLPALEPQSVLHIKIPPSGQERLVLVPVHHPL